MNTHHVLLLVARRYRAFGEVLRDTSHFLRKSIKRSFSVSLKSETRSQHPLKSVDWKTVVYKVKNKFNYEIQVSRRYIWFFNHTTRHIELKIDRVSGAWLKGFTGKFLIVDEVPENGTVFNFESGKAVSYNRWRAVISYPFDPIEFKKNMKQVAKDVEMVQTLELFE